MFKIALVDDSLEALDQLELFLVKFFVEKNVQYEINKFSHGFNFLDSLKNDYQLVFLDIDMPGINGLDIARKIRKVDTNVLIVFVTNMAGCAINGYEVAATDFLVKPIKKEQLYFCLNRCLEKLANTHYKKITIKTSDGYIALMEDKIVYVEVRLHSLIFHTIDSSHECYGSLKDLENVLSQNKFSRCNSCYLVNLNYVESINGDTCKLINAELPISRSKKKVFIEKFMKNI